ncbi:MAG: hypothetical protein LBD78_09755 [Spirochaetaceae bacterium]|jgi:hypothetical protein|nr:hypothetical protein [Spirochaetaceae bacterium]
MSKKVVLFVWSFTTALFISSCSFTIPKKVVIKGNPDFALPLGTLQLPIEEYLSIDAVGDVMGEDNAIGVYDYLPAGAGTSGEGDPSVQTFLIHFPVNPLAFNLNAEQFGFNTDGTAVSGPDIKVPLLDKVSNSVLVSVPGGTLVPGRDLPLSETDSVVMLMIDDEDFIEAEVKEGYLVLSGRNEALDFSKVTIRLVRPGTETAQEISPLLVEDEWRYDLAGQFLYPDMMMQLRGSVSVGTTIQAPVLTIDLAPRIIELRTLQVQSAVREQQTIRVDFTDPSNGWIRSIAFSKTGLRLKVNPRLDGLTVQVDVPELAIQEPVQQFSADNFQTGLEFWGANTNIDWSADFGIQITVNPGRNDILTLYDIRPGNGHFPVVVEPESLFVWDSITVNLSEMPPDKRPNLSGSFPGEGKSGFDLSGLMEFFDDPDKPGKVLFDSIPLRLYLSGYSEILETIGINITAQYGSTLESLTGGEYKKPMSNGMGPDFQADAQDGVYRKELESADLAMDLTDCFNARADFVLIYDIRLSDKDITIFRQDTQIFEIRPDLIVELPLAFRIAADDPSASEAVLTLSQMFGENEDLFGRSPPGFGDPSGQTGDDGSSKNQVADMFETITVDLVYTNTITAGLRLGGFDEPKIIVGNKEGEMQGQQTFKFNKADMAYPFAPKVEVFVSADQTDQWGNRYGLLKIKRGAGEIPIGITMDLSVVVETDITIDLL